MYSSSLGIELAQSLQLLPVLLVLGGGLVAALVHWRNHPTPALLTTVAVVVLALATILSVYIPFWLIRQRVALAWTIQQFGFASLAVYTVLNVLRALGYGLLVAAVFVGRRPAPPSLLVNP